MSGDQSKYQKDESVFFKFIGHNESGPSDTSMNSDNFEAVGYGAIENIWAQSDGFYYDIHHGQLTCFVNFHGYLKTGTIPEKTEKNIPEKDINYTGQF